MPGLTAVAFSPVALAVIFSILHEINRVSPISTLLLFSNDDPMRILLVERREWFTD